MSAQAECVSTSSCYHDPNDNECPGFSLGYPANMNHCIAKPIFASWSRFKASRLFVLLAIYSHSTKTSTASALVSCSCGDTFFSVFTALYISCICGPRLTVWECCRYTLTCAFADSIWHESVAGTGQLCRETASHNHWFLSSFPCDLVGPSWPRDLFLCTDDSEPSPCSGAEKDAGLRAV